MVSIIIGVVSLILFVIVAFPVLPWEFLHLSQEIIFVLKGAIPLGVALFGVFSLLIGFTDLIDKKHARKEAKIQQEFEESEKSPKKF